MDIIIMMGASSSGKSTFVENNTPANRHVFSADHHFMICQDCGMRKAPLPFNHPLRINSDNPCGRGNHRYQYNFDFSQLQVAHGNCFWPYTDHIRLMGRDDTLVVDNTNTTIGEIAPYIQAATGACAISSTPPTVRVVYMDTPLSVCLGRNPKGLNAETIEKQYARLRYTLDNWPHYWPKYELHG